MIETLNIAQICPTTYALGPGKRFVIWVQGCPFNCTGCIAPDWIPLKTASIVRIQDLVQRIIASDDLEGITISGGEPALQASGLARLLYKVKAVRPNLSAIAFSGFTLEQLRKRAISNTGIAEFLNHLDVLIDGLYVKDLNDDLGLRGSSNQRVRFLTDRYKALKDSFESGPRQVEVHLLKGELLMVGVPTERAFEATRSIVEEIKERWR
jgi:anaerobic ribonucleoside-triphosphate reductase activating protein